MPEAVYRMMMLLCALVAPLPVGTNLGLLLERRPLRPCGPASGTAGPSTRLVACGGLWRTPLFP